jgi:hypothetical protein
MNVAPGIATSGNVVRHSHSSLPARIIPSLQIIRFTSRLSPGSTRNERRRLEHVSLSNLPIGNSQNSVVFNGSRSPIDCLSPLLD